MFPSGVEERVQPAVRHLQCAAATWEFWGPERLRRTARAQLAAAEAQRSGAQTSRVTSGGSHEHQLQIFFQAYYISYLLAQ